MKQIIVLFAMVMLGVFIFSLIMGDSENSIINLVKEVWSNELEAKTRFP